MNLLCLLLLLGTERQWCEDPIESALIIRTQARKAQGPIDFVRILFRAQARKAQGPIAFVRIIILIFFDYPGILGGLNMVKNCAYVCTHVRMCVCVCVCVRERVERD